MYPDHPSEVTVQMTLTRQSHDSLNNLQLLSAIHLKYSQADAPRTHLVNFMMIYYRSTDGIIKAETM